VVGFIDICDVCVAARYKDALLVFSEYPNSEPSLFRFAQNWFEVIPPNQVTEFEILFIRTWFGWVVCYEVEVWRDL
jgi:hypothetical protein